MLVVQLDPTLSDVAGGEKHIFAAGTSIIRFGRSIDSDVRLSPSDTRLGRHHFSLRAAAGSYELVTDREHPVFMNGERVVGSVVMLPATELKLVDGKSGPAIKIIISQDADGALTDANFKTDSGTVQQGLKFARNAGVAALGVAIVLSGLYFYQAHQQTLLQQAFTTETQELLQKFASVEQQAPAANWSKVYEQAKASVYQVGLLNNDGSAPQAMGTAWVYGAHSLVTNAHVAALLNSKGANQKLVVIAPDGQQTPIAVIDAILHPAYLSFRETIDATERSTGTTLKTQGSFDVALLTVDSAVKLAPPLIVADAATLQNLKPGDGLAYIGYPTAFAKDQSEEQLRIGYVSGASDFLGVAQTTTGELLYHTAPAVGGASGSPILNEKGEVIAVHSGGETRGIADTFVNSGSATFYAQNANLIADLTTGWSSSKMDSAQSQWQAATLYLAKRNQIWALLQTYRDSGSLDRLDTPPDFESKSIFDVESDNRSLQTASVAQWSQVQPGTYVAFATQQGGGKISLRVKAGNTNIQAPLYLDAAPTAIFKIENTQDVMFSVSGAKGSSYWLQVLKLNDAKLKQ